MMKAATLPRPSETPPCLRRTTGPARRSSKGHWTPEEDEILGRAVDQFKGKKWKKIAEFLPDRTKVQCLHRWQKVLNPELVKGSWSKEEDGIIVQMVHKYGPKEWSRIAQALPGRIGKQCRERWHNHLNPNINKETWTQEEEITLIHAHSMLGNKWVELTKYLPGRSENSIKNHWNCSVKNKVNLYAAMGLLQYPPPLPSTENTLHPQHGIPNSNNPSSSSLNPQGSRGMLFSPLQDKRGNHTKGTELEIDTALEDNPDKENIPPDPGSGSKTTPINEGATQPSLSTSGVASESKGISRTLKKRKYIPCQRPGSGSGGTVSSAIKELQVFAAALLAEDKDLFKEESELIEDFQYQKCFSPPKRLKLC